MIKKSKDSTASQLRATVIQEVVRLIQRLKGCWFKSISTLDEDI